MSGNGTHLNVVDMIAVPQSSEHRIAKAKGQDVLDHLFSKIVVDPEYLALFPIRLQLFV